MSRFAFKIKLPRLLTDVGSFLGFLKWYFRSRGYQWFVKFEGGKSVIVDLLYKQRGRYTRPFLHFGTIALVFLVITFGPYIIASVEEQQPQSASSSVINPTRAYASFNTLESEEVKYYRGGETITHAVQEGETLSSIAERYNLQVSTIVWENAIDEKTKLKPGQTLRILPEDGVRHKVSRGETIFSIAKKYGLEDEAEAQAILNYPFNEFLNDETFELATGQFLMVPGGEKKDQPTIVPVTRVAQRLTPDAGSVTATGAFVWPASGKITQGYRFYHKAYDIANRSGGPILAADSGTVIVAGWTSSGYGNHIMVDHGNGYVTLYAHLSLIQVREGQRLNRGDVMGQMGSTGRSTGTHLHFEIRRGGILLDPSGFLR